MITKDEGSFKSIYKQCYLNGSLSEDEDYQLTTAPSRLPFSKNNHFSEKIIIGQLFSSAADLEKEEKPLNEQGSRKIEQLLTSTQEYYRDQSITKMLDEFKTHPTKDKFSIRTHSLETLDAYSYYDSHCTRTLFKTTRAKVLFLMNLCSKDICIGSLEYSKDWAWANESETCSKWAAGKIVLFEKKPDEFLGNWDYKATSAYVLPQTRDLWSYGTRRTHWAAQNPE